MEKYKKNLRRTLTKSIFYRKSLIIPVFALILIACLSESSLADNTHLLSLPMNVYDTNGDPVNGDVIVEIWDSATAGTLIYNSTEDFLGNISSGKVDIMLGKSAESGGINPLNLTFGQNYFMEIYAANVDVDFSGLERKEFTSFIGNITSSTFDSAHDFKFGGGYGNTGITLEADGDIWMDGDLYIGGDTYIVEGQVVNGSITASIDNTFFFGNTTNRYKQIVIGTGDSSFAGNVGIGTTSPSAKLDIAGSSLIDLNVSGLLYVNQTRIGIGTANPAGLLDVGQDGIDQFVISSTEARPVYKKVGGNIIWNLLYWGTDSAAMVLKSAGTTKVYLATDRDSYITGGNLGIGTETPSHKLNVVGGLINVSIGSTPAIIIDANTSAVACVSGWAGGIIYSGGKHYGCDGSVWNAFY